MAQYTTTTDVYNLVADCLLEPYASGLYPGLSLGIVTLQEFLTLFGVVLEDFVNRTGLQWSIFTQQVNFNQSTYQFPEAINEPKVAFVGGQYVDHATLYDLDDWEYGWQGKMGVPDYWYSDGLPPKTIGVAANPNYSGASYTIPVGPSAPPPYGVNGLFNGATPGQYSGILVVSGTTGTWGSGALFDLNWNNYYPLPTMTLNGTVYHLASVNSTTGVTFVETPASQSYFWQVNVGNDGNLSIVGTTGLASITYTLGQLIPCVPDSFCFYLAYGVLARIFSTDGEAKDLQRSYYCNARYLEGISAAAAVSGEMLAIG